VGEEDSTQTVIGDVPLRFGPRTRSGLSGIERFTILKKLGEGGMGSVYAAYDSALDRRVAVKVVRSDRRASADPVTPRAQLLREAQAMARLSHPNVVAIHEVGEIGEGVFVVLELVDGTTMHEWLRERARGWREIVDAFVQVGQGLAAAHDAGLVHRDVKPANVMIRRDGRIQIGDFGVVSMSGSGSSSDRDGDRTEPEHIPNDITFVGRRVGTLAYMAPEQYAGAAVDGRADQFAFCVSLWESLYGARPFAGQGAELAAAARSGTIQPPPTTARVPRYLEQPLRRGLSPKAEDRFPTMAELLDALRRDPERTRRRWLAGGVLFALFAGIATWAWVGWTRRPAVTPPCADQAAPLANRWDADRAAAVRAAFATSNVPFATSAATRVTSQLDAWSARWVDMRVEACRATRVTGEQSDALLDARMRCLDRQLDEVAQVAAALVTTDRDVIARAAETLEVPDVSLCANRDYVLARVPPPESPLARARVEGVEHELAAASARERTGHYREGRRIASAAATTAEELAFAPLLAEALLVRGRLEQQDGDTTAARATLTSAVRAAGVARDDITFARALVSLLDVLVERAEVPAALALAVAVEAAVARTHDRVLEADLAVGLGAAHQAAGDLAAETHMRRALALRESLYGASSVQVAQLLNRLGGAADARGQAADARALYERALAIVDVQLGPEHPSTTITRANLCYLDAEAGKLAEARTCQEAVLAMLERALGPSHPQVAWALNEVALVQRQQTDRDGAARRFERALAIWEAASGPTHPDVAWPLINLGEIAIERGELRAAEASCTRALSVIEAASGAAHPDTTAALTCLANAAASRAPRDAIGYASRAIATGAAHGHTADAELSFILARALVATGDARRGVEIGREALGAAEGDLRAQITAWLHGR